VYVPPLGDVHTSDDVDAETLQPTTVPQFTEPEMPFALTRPLLTTRGTAATPSPGLAIVIVKLIV
jgi:hypothetical protein